jgi:hypothetical protein
MAEIDDFDLDRSTAQAWTEFQARLSEVISMIDDSGDLTIGIESSRTEQVPFVRFSAPTRDVLHCEAASNPALGEHFQLSVDQLQTMEQLGWRPPEVDLRAGQEGASGSTGNFWTEAPQEQSDRLAALAVGALRDVYGVPHPVFLAPDQLAEVLKPAPTTVDGSPVPGSELEAAPRRQTKREIEELVDAEMTRMFGHRPIHDEEGDVAIRVGSTMIFLRTSADAMEVVVFAAVVHEITGRSRAAEVLNDLNVEARWVKFMLVRDRVFVTFSVQAQPFVAPHLHRGVRIVSEVADGIDDELATKLDGRTTFPDNEA